CVGGGDPLGLVLGLLPGDGSADASGHPTRCRGQVEVTGLGEVRGHAPRAGVDVVLELTRGPVQSILVPGEHDVDTTGAEVVEQPRVRGPRLAGVRGNVVVGVDVHDVQVPGFCERCAVLHLPVDTEAGAGPVLTDPHVDRGL